MFLVKVEACIFLLVEVLSGVCGLVFEDLHEAIESYCEQGAECRADPVEPVIARKATKDDAGTEGAGRVERAYEPVNLVKR